MTTFNVLYVVAYPQRMAGANRSLFELVRSLPSWVHPVVVVAGEGPVAAAYRDAGIACEVVEPQGLLATHGGVLQRSSLSQKVRSAVTELLPLTAEFRRLIRRFEVRLVHVNDARAAVLAGPAALSLGRPIVGHLRGEMPFGALLRSGFEHLSSRIITVSEAVRSTLSLYAQAKARTVYNGVRSDLGRKAGSVRWLESLGSNGVVPIGCFASVVPFKGHHHLLHAVAQLNESGLRERFCVVIVGDVPQHSREYFEWLLQLSAELRVDNVTFAGWQSDPFPFYASVEASVLASVSEEILCYGGRDHVVRGNEGLPRTHLEAMMFGLPIVGTRIAGVPEQISDGVNGFIVEPSDSQALAGAIGRIVTDSDCRDRLGAEGRRRALAQFSVPSCVAGVLDVYAELIPEIGDRSRRFRETEARNALPT